MLQPVMCISMYILSTMLFPALPRITMTPFPTPEKPLKSTRHASNHNLIKNKSCDMNHETPNTTCLHA